jgi:hypothetical protein
MINRLGAPVLYITALFACCLYNSERNYSSIGPDDELTHESDQIPVSIGAFPKFENIPKDNPDGTNYIEYPSPWEYQSTSVPGNEQEICWTVVVVVLLFINFVIWFMKYQRSQRIRSYHENGVKQLKATEARIQEYEKNHVRVGNNIETLMAKLKTRKIVHETDAQFQNDVDSTKTVNMEHDWQSQDHKEVHSAENTEEEVGRLGECHSEVDCIKEMLLKVIQKLSSEGQIEINSIEIIEGEDHPVGAQNEMNSMKLKEEDEPRARYENKMNSTETVTKTVDKVSANFQKDLDPVETSEGDAARAAYIPNDVNSRKTMVMRMADEHLPDNSSFMDALNIMDEVLKKHIARDQEPTEYPAKEIFIKTSIGAGEKEKKAEMKKAQRLFAPGPSDEATRSKVDYQDTILRHEGMKLKKTYYRKPDYSKIQPKVDTWRKH